jgi:hypothetical protein
MRRGNIHSRILTDDEINHYDTILVAVCIYTLPWNTWRPLSFFTLNLSLGGCKCHGYYGAFSQKELLDDSGYIDILM